MKILITGATGLIGQELIRYWLKKDVEIHYLTTRKNHKQPSDPKVTSFYWKPSEDQIDLKCFEGVQVIVNLAGASVSKRWTSRYKKEIRESRVKGANLLTNSIKKLNTHQITRVVSASAIGVYPHHLNHIYSETNTEIANSFLGSVVQQWEDSVSIFSQLNIAVTTLRIGLVLSAQGGALPLTTLPIRYGLGSWFGSGKQWQSWIHIEDVARMIVFTVDNQCDGIFNAVAPKPVTNKVFVKTIAQTIQRPIWLPPVPQFILKFVLGEMASILFESQHVSSKKIEDVGFKFHFSSLQSALSSLLNK